MSAPSLSNLRALRPGQLSERAASSGASAQQLEAAQGEEDATSALVRLNLELSTTLDVPALRATKVPALRERAAAAGVDPAGIDVARDADNQKEELIGLLLERQAEVDEETAAVEAARRRAAEEAAAAEAARRAAEEAAKAAARAEAAPNPHVVCGGDIVIELFMHIKTREQHASEIFSSWTGFDLSFSAATVSGSDQVHFGEVALWEFEAALEDIGFVRPKADVKFAYESLLADDVSASAPHALAACRKTFFITELMDHYKRFCPLFAAGAFSKGMYGADQVRSARSVGAPAQPCTVTVSPMNHAQGLRKMTVGALRQRAADVGVPAEQIEEARDSADPKGALIALINASQTHDQLNHTQELDEPYQRALDLGVSAEQIEDARDGDEPRNELRGLIATASPARGTAEAPSDAVSTAAEQAPCPNNSLAQFFARNPLPTAATAPAAGTRSVGIVVWQHTDRSDHVRHALAQVGPSRLDMTADAMITLQILLVLLGLFMVYSSWTSGDSCCLTFLLFTLITAWLLVGPAAWTLREAHARTGWPRFGLAHVSVILSLLASGMGLILFVMLISLIVDLYTMAHDDQGVHLVLYCASIHTHVCVFVACVLATSTSLHCCNFSL
jgi:hypothetical protein